MYKIINAKNLASGQKFMVPGHREWYTTGNEPYLWKGKLHVPCTRNTPNGIRSLELKLGEYDKVKVWK